MLSIHGSIADIGEFHWNRLLGASGCPFLDFRFLRALETTGCVGGRSGWTPVYLTYGVAEPEACLAAYIKTHSYGEYIFDWAWADAALRMGFEYYPKLVVGAPFSPVAGPRFLGDCSRSEVRIALLDGLDALAKKISASSIHALFTTESEANWLVGHDFIKRDTFQFQWTNEGYGSFDEFLNRFKSKRRNQIKRERRRSREDGIDVRIRQGSEITPQDIQLAYEFYSSTVERFYSGQKYLNREFFFELYRTMSDKLCLIQAVRDEAVIAGTFNLVSDDVFYGRYWGCLEDVKDLHFEVCCYMPVELAIKRGWRRVELGAGGQHKWGRGFLPTLTYSAHRLFLEPLVEPVRRAVEHESRQLRAEIDRLKCDVLKSV